MANIASVTLYPTDEVYWIGRFGTNYEVQTPSGIRYFIYIDANSLDPVFIKSTNKGVSWSKPIQISAVTSYQIAIWYDKWSSIAAGLIHMAYIDGVTNNVLYKNLDTENNDALSSESTIFDGASVANQGSISITRTRGLNLICGGCIDAGVEIFCAKSTDVGANWSNIAAVSESAVNDQLILLPGFALDNQDAMCFFWDASADEISRKIYDDSANTWSELSISGSMVDVVPSIAYMQFSATVDVTNSQNILIAWSSVDTANADLRCWKIKEDVSIPGDGISEVTNVVLNSADDQGLCAISINKLNEYWYVLYGGKSDGSETHRTALNMYMKISQDGGSTWGNEIALTSDSNGLRLLFSSPWNYLEIGGVYLASNVISGSTLNFLKAIASIAIPRSTFQFGM